MLQPKKPKFDPNKPFDVVEKNDETVIGSKPKFDPNKPFEVVKKKESSEVTSVPQKLASEQKVGSSVTPKLTREEKSEFDTAFKSKPQPKNQTQIDSGSTSFVPENVSLSPKELLFGEKEKSIIDNFRRATVVPVEKDAEFEQEYNAKINNEGILNQAKTGLKNWWNKVFDVEPALQASTDPLIDERKKAIIELKEEQEGKEPNEQEIKERTKEIFISDKKANYKQSLVNDFMENLSDDERDAVGIKITKQLPSLEKDYVGKSNALIVSLKEIESIDKELAQMERIVKEQSEMGNNNLDPKFYEEAKRLYNLRENKLTVLEKLDKDIYESQSKLGTAMEEYDVFKRSYGDLDVLGNRLKTGIAKIGYGLNSFKNYLDRADRTFGTQIEGFTPELEEIKKSDKEISFANKVIDKEQEFFRKRLEEVNNVGDFVNYVTDVAGDQIPNMLPFIMTGGVGGGAVIFGSSSGNQYAEMVEGEINPTPFARKYTNEEKFIAPAIFGASDAVLSAVPTYGRLLRGKRTVMASISESGGKELFKNSALESAKKGLLRIGKDNLSEQIEEQSANLIQNFTRVVYLKEEDASMLDGVEDVFKDTATFSTLLSAFPVAMGGVIRAVTPKTDIVKIDNNSKEIIALKQRINKGGLSESTKQTIQSQIDKKVAENKTMIMDTQKRMKSKGDVFVGKINELDKEIQSTFSKANEIKESNLTKPEKEVLLQGLKDDYKRLSDRREFLLSDNSNAMDVLPIKEVDALKREALKELAAELNPDGKKNIEIKDEQITERANKIYAKQIESKRAERAEKKLEEAQPQAEKQAIESEVVSETKEQAIQRLEAELESITDDNNPRIAEIDAELQALESNNNQINEVNENAPSQEVVAEIPDSKQIKKGFYSQEEIDANNEFYDNQFNEISDEIEKKLKEKGEYSFEKLSQELQKDKRIIENDKNRNKLYSHNNKIIKSIIFNAIENIDLKGRFYGNNLKNIIQENLKTRLSKRFLLENEDVNISEKLIGSFEGKELEGIKQDFVNVFLPSGTKFNDLSSDQKSEALEKTKDLFDKFIADISESIVKNTENEATPSQNIAPDGNVQLGVEETSKGDFIKVYHGGNVSSNKEMWEGQPLFVSEDKNQANEYTKENKGKVVEFNIDKRKIADEDIAREVINELGVSSKEEGWDIDELNMFELIDPNFSTSLNDEDISKLFKKLESMGYEGIEFYDTNLKTLKQDIKNIVVFNPQKTLKQNETTPTNTAPTNEGVQPRTNQVGEVAVEQKPTAEVVEEGGVQPANEPRAIEQKQLTPEQKKQNSLIDLKNEYNNLNNREKKGKKGSALKLSIMQLSKEMDFKVDEIRGKIKITKKSDGKNVGKIAFKEEIKESEQSDIDFVKGQIEQGALLWNNDPMSPRINLGISRSDINKGVADIQAGKVNSVPAKRLVQAMAEQRKTGSFEFIQGSGQNIVRMEVPIIEDLNPQEQEVADVLENYHTDEEIQQYFTELEQLNKQENENIESVTEKIDDTSNSEGIIEKPGIEGKNISKEKRKEIINKEVDDLFQKIKDILPGIKDNDINAQGFSQDQLIDLVATAVKNLIAAGIEIDEAIKQVVASIKDRFGIEVNPDDVKAKLEPQRNETFEKKSGKKSLLGRAVSGGESSKITDAIAEYGLDYEIESQEKAQESAKSFIEKVGFDNALEVVRSNKIKGAEKAFVYAELIDILTSEIDSQIDGDERIALEEKHYQIMAEIMNEFDIESRDAGRFISALNRVYNSTNFKYNLSRQVKAYKARNNGEISAEKLQEYKEIDAKLKDLEQKIKEAEQRAMDAEAKLAMENIVEEVQRVSKKPTIQSNAKKAKDLANKIRRGKINKPDIFMSATPASLVWDGAIEVVAKSIEAGGSVADSIQKGIDYIKKSDWYKKLSDSDKKRAEKGLEDHVRQDTKPAMVYIDEDGNIKVPESLIRSLVEEGVNDIDDLSERVLDTIIDEYPEITLRQVRDAITKYGKTINPNPEKIASEIRKLRRMGKLISGLEDAKSGKRPLRSGLQRDELTQDERKMKRELRDLLRDLPLDDDSIERTWKTALDAIKSRLRNQIEDLEKQIENKEKSKPEKTPIEYDEEAKQLKQTRDELKETLENIVGKPELSYEQKVTRAIASLERSISKLNDQISTKNIEYKEKPIPVTSNLIEELKQQKKKLTEEVNQMRIDSGIAETRKLQLAKSRIRNRIADLETRIKEKNYTTKKAIPLKADQELLNLQAEKIRIQERYDKDKYIDELNKRSLREKIFDEILSLWNIPRVLMATGEASWIMIQGGIQTINRTLTNPKQMFEIFKKMFKAMASDSKAKEYESITKARENYITMKQSKLALTEVDHKLEAKEEQFLGDFASVLWDLFGKGLGKISGKKEFKSPYAFMMELLGKELKGTNKATLEQYWKNANPLRILERGNSVYMNELRIARFEEGVQMLESELKNPIDNLEDYKKLASAINTMTGRANIGMLQTNSKLLSVIFFSFRNAVSVINQLNPYFYLSLGNPKEPFKASVAQKIAITDMMKFVTTTTGMLLLLQAAVGFDDDEEDKPTIETDPRSSDFGKLKIGNLRIDPWHGMMPAIVLFSRIWTDENKNVNTGEISKGGTKFGSRTREQLMLDFATNKFNPSMGILWKYLSSHHEEVDGKEIRMDRYGKEYDVLSDVANLKPMYWDAISEIKKEQPGLWGDFFITTAALGINSQVYDKPKEKKNSYQRPKRPSIPRPKMP
jgi:hypothetical protein